MSAANHGARSAALAGQVASAGNERAPSTRLVARAWTRRAAGLVALAPVVCAVLASALACTKTPPVTTTATSSADDPHERELSPLEHEEAALRASTDWATFPSSDRALGPDPIDVVALHDGYAGILRGADAVVLLDKDGNERARAEAPRAPRAISVDESAGQPRILVVGEHSNAIASYVIAPGAFGDALARSADIAVAGVDGMRGVVAGNGGSVDVVDLDGVLRAVNTSGATVSQLDIGAMTVGVRRAGDVVVAMSVLAHRIIAVPVDAHGAFDAAHAAHIDNDGPFWGFDVRAVPDGVLVAAGHVEDHKLDRSGGSFGYIDSYVRVVHIGAVGGGALEPRTLREVNASEAGVVIPKALAFLDDETVLAVGAGSGRGFQLDVATGKTEPVAALPGISAVAVSGNAVLGASPLLDAWIVLDATPRASSVPSTTGTRTLASRLGEALVFTTIMAPRQKSDAQLSRFTCEACHFEGGGDGRIHDTSRKDDSSAVIFATTKPLFGLFNNKPLFTRAMDENLTQMAHAEFRVANANSALDPWFALTSVDAPWLSLIGVKDAQQPLDLRRALVAFLHDFTPRTNAHVAARSDHRFTVEEQRGAEVFRARCASCHTPRLVGDAASTAQPFDAWEHLVMSDNGPLVWSGDGRVKTGIEPYVHVEGARPSSLRRIERKRPYFTNGSSPTLDDVVARARFDGATFAHASSDPRLHALDAADQHALVAFLRLL